jgi:triosephosphate isomerase
VRGPRPSIRPPLGAPLLLLNLKTYPNALGPGAVRLAQLLERSARAAGVAAAIAPAAPDLARVAAAVRIPVLAQHVDPISPGATTGWTPAEALQAAGARGALVNHSEHPSPPGAVRSTVQRLDALGLAAVVCAPSAARAGALAANRPPYLAVEPPELIGGHRSVSTARPALIAATVETVGGVSPRTAVLCGAGVHDRRDVQRALELGSRGILVASAVTRAAQPARAIEELLRGF